jgi:UDP-glucose 4-epimerase
MAKILITGGNGFIGSHLAEKLIEQGEEVTLLDIVFNENSAGIDCEKIEADVRDYDKVKEAVNGKDSVIHFAAVSRVAWGQERPRECIETNSVGTANVLEAVREAGNEAFVFLGSSREVYGEPESNPVNEKAVKNPISIYGISKLSGEKLALSYKKYFGTRVIIFRFSNVYGAKRDLPERVMPNFAMKAINGEPLIINGGDQVLDFTFLDDTLNGILKAYEKRESIIGQDFHFVTGKGTSVQELAETILSISGSDAKIEVRDVKSFDVKKFIGDNSKSKEILDWQPEVSLEDGIKKMIDAYS